MVTGFSLKTVETLVLVMVEICLVTCVLVAVRNEVTVIVTTGLVAVTCRDVVLVTVMGTDLVTKAVRV